MAGCSLALSGPDPNRAVTAAPECDTGKGLVGVDGLFGAGFAIGSLAALGNEEGEAAAITGLIGVAFIAAAVHGNSVVNECRAQMTAFADKPDRPMLPETPPAPEVASRPAVRTVAAPPRPQPQAELDVEPEPAPPPPAKPAAPAKPVKPAPPQPEPAAAQADDWTDFWTEVP